MAKFKKVIKGIVGGPVYSLSRDLVRSHESLWRRDFWQEWEPQGVDKKIIWLVFVTNTVALLTIFEYMCLRLFK